MLATTLELSLAPLLIGACCYAAQRWGDRTAGLLSGVPAIAGPLLLAVGCERGQRFAAATAAAIVTGLVSLAGFCLLYALVARRARWPLALLAGWSAAASLSALTLALSPGPVAGLLATAAALALVRALSAAGDEQPVARSRRVSLPANMALGACLVALLALTARALGPQLGGAVAALPVVVSVLAVSAHRSAGAAGAVVLLAAIPSAMVGFVAFCETVALLAVPAGLAFALAAATLLALSAQAVALSLTVRRGGMRALEATRA